MLIGGAGLWENRGSVTVLDSHPSVRGFDHSITSPTYQSELITSMYNYRIDGLK
ncbi:MAG: hypothetical protein S4CHLAM81_12760 [Chlamydiales bacterium]|nr:hypothetical protein [Chlamydiales bacterium]MCH9636051.1 hypothetical protein [Chlamydiales bacterium]